MKLLSRVEEIILLSIWRLRDDAYGITIKAEVEKATGKEWNLGAIYGPLTRLDRNGYVKVRKGEPTPERGGRSKIYYEISKEGKKALKKIYEVNSIIWDEIPSFVSEART